MTRQMPGGRRQDYLRRAIEQRAGRPLEELMRELYCGHGQTSIQLACACTRLAGEEVSPTLVEEWLHQFRLDGRTERWAAMVPRLKNLLEELIAEEVDRRSRKGYHQQG